MVVLLESTEVLEELLSEDELLELELLLPP